MDSLGDAIQCSFTGGKFLANRCSSQSHRRLCLKMGYKILLKSHDDFFQIILLIFTVKYFALFIIDVYDDFSNRTSNPIIFCFFLHFFHYESTFFPSIFCDARMAFFFFLFSFFPFFPSMDNRLYNSYIYIFIKIF